MLDAPRSDAAFAAALPMAGVPAWRVHLGMPMCGSRMVDGKLDAIYAAADRDTVLAFLEPCVRQAVEEFPSALGELRKRLPVDDKPVGVVGGSLGGAVALRILSEWQIPVAAAALINPAVRARSVVSMIEGSLGRPYQWTDAATAAADQLDFVARAEEVAAGRAPVLIISGERDEPVLRTDATALAAALHERYVEPDQVRLVTIPDLAHPLADEPGIEPAPQLPVAKAVDDVLTEWFTHRLTSDY